MGKDPDLLNLADAVEIIANLHALADALDDAGRNPSLSDHDRRTTHNIVESLEHNVPNLPSTTPAPAARYARLEDRLKGLSATERAEFDKMFAEKSTHLERFDAKPGLVDGWLVIKDDSKFTKWLLSGATDKEFADVERIANYIQKNPHLRASVAEEFAALGKDAKVAWAIRLEEFQELTKIEEKLATIKPELRGAFRSTYAGSYYSDIIKAAGERPELIDAWQVLRSNNSMTSNLCTGSPKEVLGYLEDVADYLGSTKRSLDDIISEFKTLNTLNKQKDWIAGLAAAARSSFARFEGNTFRWLQTLEVDQKVITTQNNASGMVVFFNTEGVAARIGEVNTAGPARFHIDPAAAELQNYSGYNLKYVKEEIDVTLNGVDLPKTDVGIVCKNGKCSVIPGACFTGGTPVHTVKGLKPIESIKAGDSVYAYNGKSGSRTVQPVMRTFTRAFTRLVKVFAGKDTLTTTTNHPFFADNVWTPARALKKGARILLLSGMLSSVDSVAMIDSLATVYNFEVAGDHDYYVGTEGFLVHNASGGLCDILKESKYTGITLKNDALRKL